MKSFDILRVNDYGFGEEKISTMHIMAVEVAETHVAH